MPFYFSTLLTAAKFPKTLFQIWTSQGNQLVLPARYLDELKMMPDTKFPSALRVV